MSKGILDIQDCLRQMTCSAPVKHHFRIHRCYNVRVNPLWAMNDRLIDDLHLLLVKGGEGTYIINETSTDLRKGALYLVTTGCIINSTQNLKNPPFILPVRFGVYDNKTGRQIPYPGKTEFIRYIPQSYFLYEQLFEENFMQFNRLQRTGDAQAASATSTLLHFILLKINDDLQRIDRMQGGEQDSLNKVTMLMDESVEKRISVANLSRQAGLSPKYFSRKFKLQHGMSPKQYLMQKRLNHARMLLESTGQPIKEVAASLSYSDQYVFSKQFKALFGYPPSHARGGKCDASS